MAKVPLSLVCPKKTWTGEQKSFFDISPCRIFLSLPATTLLNISLFDFNKWLRIFICVDTILNPCDYVIVNREIKKN